MSSLSFQPSPFEPIASYDVPGILASELLDGEATLRGGMAALFDPSKLSPVERDTINTRLKKAAGESSVAGALIDVALNPFVWGFFLTSPVAGSALAEGAGSIFRSAKRYSAWVEKQAPVLRVMGGSTAIQTMRGTPMAAVAAQANAAYESYLASTVERYAPELEDLLKRNGLRSLDPREIADPAKRELTGRISKTIAASLSGLDRERPLANTVLATRYFAREGTELRAIPFDEWRDLAPSARSQEVKLTTSSQTAQPWVQGVEEELQSLGATGLRDRLRDALNHELKTLYGREGAAAYEVDEAKVVNQWRAARNPVFNPADDPAAGRDLVSKLMGPEFQELVRAGAISKDDYLQFVRESFGKGVSAETYFPRNVVQTVLPDGTIATPEVFQKMRQARAFRVPGASIGRENIAGENLHLDDLRWLQETFQGTPALEEAIANTEGRLADNAERGRSADFHRLDLSQALNRHFKASAESYAWHLQPPNDEVRAVLRQSLEDRQAAGLTGTAVPGHTHFEPNAFNPEQPAAPLTTHPDDIPSVQQPGSGLNLADVAYQSYSLSENQYARDTMVRLVIPGATGRLRVQHAASLAAGISARQNMAAFADSRLGKSIEGTGEWGQRFVQGLRDRAALEVQPSGALDTTRFISHLLYASHLGLNMGAVVMNATQPWLWGAAFLGSDNVAKGYGRALKEMGGYFTERSGQGFRALNEAEQSALVHKHFRWANMEGEDFLGISRSIEESLDPMTFSRSPGSVKSRADRLFNFMMQPFQKVEWLNRSVVAHAVEAAHERQGAVNMGLLKSDVRQAVAETQFGSTFLNTPAAFVSDDSKLTAFGRVPTHPLARQFFSYPFRSLSTLLEVAPKIGRGERTLGITGLRTSNPLLVAGNDVLRGMAISAVGYEMAKNLMGADISRGLFAASALQLPGQFISDKNGAVIPAPPVLQIVGDMAQFIGTGNLDLLRTTVPRVIPGGLALSKALGLAPKLPEWIGALAGQKTYAGWGQLTADGRVPIFQSDGTLVEMQAPSEVVFRALGADLGRFQTSGALDKFLLSNREEIVGYRRQYLAKMVGNDPSGAEGVAREYERRFKLPFTVTKGQLKQAIQQRQVPRTERVLDRLPSEARPVYQAIVAQQPGRFNVSGDRLTELPTMSGRNFARDPSTEVRLDSQTIAELKRQMGNQPPTPPAARHTFDPFESF